MQLVTLWSRAVVILDEGISLLTRFPMFQLHQHDAKFSASKQPMRRSDAVIFSLSAIVTPAVITGVTLWSKVNNNSITNNTANRITVTIIDMKRNANRNWIELNWFLTHLLSLRSLQDCNYLYRTVTLPLNCNWNHCRPAVSSNSLCNSTVINKSQLNEYTNSERLLFEQVIRKMKCETRK